MSESIILINVVSIFTAEKRVKGVFAELARNLCAASAPHVLSGELSLQISNDRKLKTNHPLMPIFFQHQIDDSTRLGVWKIEETEKFFKGNVPQHRDVTHPHKRLQHLAGRFLLQYLFPDFPYELIVIADTRKPYLKDEEFHFSISHCGDYAAAIVSKDSRVGIDIEVSVEKVLKIAKKFLSREEHSIFNIQYSMFNFQLPTLLWSAKESVYKWYGNGGVDFRTHIQLKKQYEGTETIDCYFTKTNQELTIYYRLFEHLVLSWVVS